MKLQLSKLHDENEKKVIGWAFKDYKETKEEEEAERNLSQDENAQNDNFVNEQKEQPKC